MRRQPGSPLPSLWHEDLSSAEGQSHISSSTQSAPPVRLSLNSWVLAPGSMSRINFKCLCLNQSPWATSIINRCSEDVIHPMREEISNRGQVHCPRKGLCLSVDSKETQNCCLCCSCPQKAGRVLTPVAELARQGILCACGLALLQHGAMDTWLWRTAAPQQRWQLPRAQHGGNVKSYLKMRFCWIKRRTCMK